MSPGSQDLFCNNSSKALKWVFQNLPGFQIDFGQGILVLFPNSLPLVQEVK